jgi:hypothetical protein
LDLGGRRGRGLRVVQILRAVLKLLDSARAHLRLDHAACRSRAQVARPRELNGSQCSPWLEHHATDSSVGVRQQHHRGKALRHVIPAADGVRGRERLRFAGRGC